MPNFERFGRGLKKLFVTLQDEDVAQISRVMEPYLTWQLPHVHALGLSNISILTRLSIASTTLHTLLLENMHTIPHFLLQDLDHYLPNLKHLEIKAPEMDETMSMAMLANEEEEAATRTSTHAQTGGSTLANSLVEHDENDENPYYLQKEYRALCPKERVTIRSTSLRSLVYTLELPQHPIFELPQLKELFYLQQENENALDLHPMLKHLPKLETAYIGVPSVRNCQVIGPKLRKIKIVFGFMNQNWSIKAPRLEKLKILRIRLDPVPSALSFSSVEAPNLKRLTLCGVVIDEISHDRMPESCFLEIRSNEILDEDDEDDDAQEHYYEHSFQMIGSQDY